MTSISSLPVRPSSPAWGLRGEDRHSRLVDAEVLPQRFLQDAQLGQDALLGDLGGDLGQGDMLCEDSYAHVIGDHQHQHVGVTIERLEEGRMAGEGEVGLLHVVLVDGGGDETLDAALLQRLGGGLEGFDGMLSADGVYNAGVHRRLVLPEVHDVDLFGIESLDVLCDIEADVDISHRLAVVVDDLVGSEDDGCAEFSNTAVGEGLDDDLGTDAVDVTHADAHDGLGLRSAHVGRLFLDFKCTVKRGDPFCNFGRCIR